MLLLVFFLVLVEMSDSADFGRNFVPTRDVLEAYQSEMNQRSYHPRCYQSDEEIPGTPQSVEDNTFLNMANFMEYVQMTNIVDARQEDAFKYFNISTAAFEYGNTGVSQESLARAAGVLVSYNARVKRDTDDEARAGHISKRAVWNPSHLFAEFRNRMGSEKFEELLHLNKKVAMAFVIDTSSSMENDMGYVRQYIQHLLVEQQNSGVSAVYIVTTFGDPSVGPTRVFKRKDSLINYLNNLQSRIGGDCEEKTCLGMLSAMYNANFNRKGNAAMYVFTDAGSKDCAMQTTVIIRTLQFTKASAYFILFDSCRPNIDPNYVQIASKTGGFCLLVRENAVFNITDTVNGAFESDALICGDDSSESNSVVGQGLGSYVRSRRSIGDGSTVKRSIEDNRSNGHDLEKNIVIDDLIDRFKVTVSISPLEYLGMVELIRPVIGHDTHCSDSNIIRDRSVADNAVVFDVKMRDCPCTGNWTLTYPAASASFSYSVKSIGEYSFAFESYFVDELDGVRIANYAPCLGVEEYMVIKLNQGEQVVTTSLSAKIVGLTGNAVYWQAQLAADEEYANTFIVKLVIPNGMGIDGFRIVLEGDVLGGSRFERQSPTIFYPTSSCLRLLDVNNYYAIFPKQKTIIKLELTNNNDHSEVYSVLCSNTENYPILISGPRVFTPGARRSVSLHSNPASLEPGQRGQFLVALSGAKTGLVRGRTVTVNCRATTSTDELMEVVRLTEMDERFYD